MSKWQNNNKKKKKRNATILLTIKEIVKQIASRMRQGEEDNQINRTERSKTMNLPAPSLRLHMKTFSVSYIYMENKYTKGSCCTSTNVADYTIHLLYHTLLHECETNKKCSARHTNFSYLSPPTAAVSWQITQVLK